MSNTHANSYGFGMDDPLPKAKTLLTTKPLDDIEMFNGGWWFTAYETPKGIIAGPFKTQREAQQAKTKHEAQ